MLEGPNIDLRAMEQEDIPLYHKWINSHEVMGMYNPLRQASKELLKNTLNKFADSLQVFIIEKKDKTRIGVILYFIVKGGPYELLEIGYFLIPSERQKGFCTEAVKMMVDFLFLTKEIPRIQAVTDIRNIGSHKVLEKSGFKKEGIMRSFMFTRGNWRDYSLYSILRKEWKEPDILKI